MKYKKSAVIILALCFAFTAVSCGKGGNNSSSTADSGGTLSSVSENSSESLQTESSSSETETTKNVQGKLIKQAYELFSGNNYTLKMKFTDSDKNVVNVTRTVNGTKYCQVEQRKNNSRGYISDGSKNYAFDSTNGIYGTTEEVSITTAVEAVVDDNLPMTTTHLSSQDTEKYDVEEYTYTGDTFITVMDFSFDKKTGNLVKYTATYSVEGEDDVVETREYTEIKKGADEKLLDMSVLKKLTDFNSLDENARETLCRKICEKNGITSDMLTKDGFTYDGFKNISYDNFVDLIYKYQGSNSR